jgi:tRNA pseudouridine-54 N-methylase
MSLSQLLTAQTYPKKKIINGDTVIVMTENQANGINVLFRNLKADSKHQRATADSLKSIVKVFDQDRNNYVRSLENAQNAYMLSEEENQMLRDTQRSLQIGRFAQDISIVTFMFTIVMLVKITSNR